MPGRVNIFRTDAEYLNRRTTHGLDVFEDRLTRNFKAIMLSGYLPFTAPRTRAQEREFLQSEDAVREGFTLAQNPDPTVRKQGLDLLRRALPNVPGNEEG